MQVVRVRGIENYSEFAPASFMYLPPVLNVVIKITVLVYSIAIEPGIQKPGDS